MIFAALFGLGIGTIAGWIACARVVETDRNEVWRSGVAHGKLLESGKLPDGVDAAEIVRRIMTEDIEWDDPANLGAM